MKITKVEVECMCCKSITELEIIYQFQSKDKSSGTAVVKIPDGKDEPPSFLRIEFEETDKPPLSLQQTPEELARFKAKKLEQSEGAKRAWVRRKARDAKIESTTSTLGKPSDVI